MEDKKHWANLYKQKEPLLYRGSFLLVLKRRTGQVLY